MKTGCTCNVLVFKYQVLCNVLGYKYKYKYIFEAQVQSTSKYSKKCTEVQASTSTDVLGPNPAATVNMFSRSRQENINN